MNSVCRISCSTIGRILRPTFPTWNVLTPAGSPHSQSMSSGTEASILFREVGDKGVIILNRPKALNALDLTMVNSMLPTLLKWEKEKSMVLIKGSGDKAFCAGGDVRTMTMDIKNGCTFAKDFFRDEYATNGVIGTYGIPYVALINGYTMGGGMGLSVHGKYRVATEKTLTAMPETAIGLFPDVGASYFLPRLQGKLGIYLALSGYRLKGAENLKVGFATHYCNSSELEKLEKALLECKDPKEVLAPYAKGPADAKFSLEPVMDKINKIFSAPTVEEIFVRLEQDGSDWAKETLASMKKFSPLSLKITLKELELGANMSLQECLQMENRLAHHACDGHDFVEGVRALLIDKDQKPKWKHQTVEQVTQQEVLDAFAPLSPDRELQPRKGPKSSL